jgi:hypothetical protein
VVIGPPGGVSTAHGQQVFKARAGHIWCRRSCRPAATCSRTGRGFTLFAFDCDDAAVRAFEQAAASLRCR